ncbi:MAG: hypothetical protein ACWA5W_07955 [Phycisphaerales bacterium]
MNISSRQIQPSQAPSGTHNTMCFKGHARRSLRRVGLIVLSAGLAMGAVSIADAKPVSSSVSSSVSSVSAGDDDGVSVRVVIDQKMLSDHLARTVLMDLGIHPIPTPDDYQLTALALSMALDLDPTNAELARAVVEAAWSSGDQELMISATRKVIAADPKDTVAQLRLVSSLINKKQTAEGRLAMYDRFLGDAGRKLDVSVRSRLALDAALLEREMGNPQGFVERLHLASKLDVSNKSAASLSAQYYSEVTGDPLMLLDRQLKLLYADPLDPNVNLTIARILAREGAFEAANRFLGNSINLYKVESGRTPDMVEEIRLALDWEINGPQKVLDDLNPLLEDRRTEAQERIDAYTEQALPTDDLLKPEEILYTLGVDKLRLLASHHLGDKVGAEKVLRDIERSVNNDIKRIGSAMGNVGVDQSMLMAQLVKSFSDFQVMRAISELEPERIREDKAKLVEAVPALGSAFDSIEPMALYGEGKYEEALTELAKYPPSPMLELIKGGAYEKLGETDKAIAVYLDVSKVYSVEAYGSYARSRLVGLGAKDQILTIAGRQMVQVAKTVPDWVDQMTTRPEFFMYLQIDPVEESVDPMDPVMVRIRLKNLAPIPLALGPSEPIDSNFLLESIVAQDTMGFQGAPVPKVLDLNHRLRLMPREELVATVRGNAPLTQWLIKMQSSTSYRLRYRLLQGPKLRISSQSILRNDPNADAPVYGIVNSPLGLTAETSLVPRYAIAESSMPVEELVAQMSNDELN